MKRQEIDEKIKEISKTIFSFCLARTKKREDAEDLAQDILVEIMKSAENIRSDAAFYGFMWSVAGNVYKSWYRKKSKSNECELDEVMEKTLPDEANDFAILFEEESDLFLLRRELSLLSKKYRDATILYYIENKSCEEIASLLSISESMVKYLLFKSRKILKEGFTMERKLGKLSYNPKTLSPMYSGTGPNRFYDFMNKKIRQNIVLACYNDLLTPEQISLETGIPLPYLDEEIDALAEKDILIKEGARYQTDIVVITAQCEEEIRRNVIKTHELLAKKMESFLEKTMADYRTLGFIGADFSENTCRWQLLTLLVRAIFAMSQWRFEKPKTAWGDHAHIWCKENNEVSPAFAYSGMSGKDGDVLLFLDYLQNPKGDHHDFYGNERYTNILLDIAKTSDKLFSEYDLEAIAEMIKKGYVQKKGDKFSVTLPVYSKAIYEKIMKIAKDFAKNEILPLVEECNAKAEKVLQSHTPRHLYTHLSAIAAHTCTSDAVGTPVKLLVEKGVLSTSYHPLEMPTTFIVLKD